MKTHYITPTFSVNAPNKCCLFCKNCRDYVYDYTNGPYMFICDVDGDTHGSFEEKCDKWEYDGGKGERVPTEDEIKKHTKYLKELIEFIETHYPAKEGDDKEVGKAIKIVDGKRYPIDPI